MLSRILGVLLMTLLTTSLACAQNQNDAADVAAVKTVMEAMAVMADRNEYDALENIFADEVEVDYTSLGGGEVEVKSNVALMTGWAGLLPGFELTRHTLSDLRAEVDGDRASGFSRVTADHWAAGLFWSVSGTYDFALRKEDGGWRITQLRLNVESETGTRDVFGAAIQRAAENPAPYLVRGQTRQTVMDFLAALETRDTGALGDMWAEDAVLDRPGAAPLAGRDRIVEALTKKLAVRPNVTAQPIIHPMLDPEQVLVEFGDAGGGSKRACLFHVTDGKINLYRAYAP